MKIDDMPPSVILGIKVLAEQYSEANVLEALALRCDDRAKSLRRSNIILFSKDIAILEDQAGAIRELIKTKFS